MHKNIQNFIVNYFNFNRLYIFKKQHWSNGPIRRSRTITADGTSGSKARPKFSAIWCSDCLPLRRNSYSICCAEAGYSFQNHKSNDLAVDVGMGEYRLKSGKTVGFHKNRLSMHRNRFVAPVTKVINRQKSKLLKLALEIIFKYTIITVHDGV